MARYDAAEESVLARMKRVLVSDHGWVPEDFEELTFLDIEGEFLVVEEDFR